MSDISDKKIILESLDKIRIKFGLKISLSPLGVMPGVIGLFFAYIIVAFGVVPINDIYSLQYIPLGIIFVFFQAIIIIILKKTHISQNNSVGISYLIMSIIIYLISTMINNSYFNITIITYKYYFPISLIYILFIIFLSNIIFILFFSLIIMIPTLAVRIFLRINYHLLSIPLLVVLVLMFNKNTWELSGQISLFQLSIFISLISIIPTIISLYKRKDVIYQWTDEQSKNILKKDKNELLNYLSSHLKDSDKLLINNFIDKKYPDLNLNNLVINSIDSLKKRYRIILFIHPLPFFILVTSIICILLLSIPNEIVINWSNISISQDMFWIRIKEGLILSSVAFTTLQLSMFAQKKNLFEMYNNLLTEDFNRDGSIELINELVSQN